MTPTIVLAWTINALLVGAWILALWRGGPAEKWGATINLIAGVIWVVANKTLPLDIREIALLSADGFLAFGLLFLGVRYASLWIGAAMLFQAVQFLLHTYYFVLELHHDLLFATVNNMVSMGVLACIFIGTFSAWRRRSAQRATA